MFGVEREVRDGWPEGTKIVLQRKCEYDRYEGVAHSFRQPYFRDRLSNWRPHWTLSLSPSVCMCVVHLRNSSLSFSLSLTISTGLSPWLQYPLSGFEDVEEKYWLSLLWNVIVVSLSRHPGETMGKNRDKGWSKGRIQCWRVEYVKECRELLRIYLSPVTRDRSW